MLADPSQYTHKLEVGDEDCQKAKHSDRMTNPKAGYEMARGLSRILVEIHIINIYISLLAANDTTLDLIQYSSDVVFPHWRGDAVFSHRMAWRSEKIFVADCELDLPITCYISEFPPCAAYSRSTRQPMWFIISLFIWIFPRQHTCINGQY